MKNNMPDTVEELEAYFQGGFEGYSGELVTYAEELLPQYLFIKKGTKREIGYCSHCQEEMNLKTIWPDEYGKWKQGDIVNCPNCGRKVTVITRNMNSLWDRGFFYWWEKGKDRKSIVCRGIVIEKGWTGGEPDKPAERLWTDSAVLFTYGAGAVMAIWKPDFLNGGEYKITRRVHARTGLYMGGGYKRAAVIGNPIDCLRAAVKGTPFRWSQWYRVERKRRTGTDIYFLLFERFARYRAWEWLTKMGLGHLLLRYAEGETGIWSLFNWRGKTVDDIFRCHLTKDDKAVLRETRIDENALRAWLKWKTFQPAAALRDVADCWPKYWGPVRMEGNIVREVMKRITPAQWRRYEKADEGEMRKFYDYVDYIGQCQRLGMDLNDRAVLWPRHFREAHEKTGEKIELMEDEILEELYEGRRESMKQKYECEDARRGLRVIVPGKLSELIEEGVQQHNCVGGYMKRVAEGETDVIFLRRADRPEQSYITVEVDPDTGYIRQAREKYNQDVQDKTAKAFLLKFERDIRRARA